MQMQNPLSQADMILEHLKQGHSITPIAALDMFGCFRLGARIWDLRALGYDIEMKLLETVSGKHIAEYRLIGRTTTTDSAPLNETSLPRRTE